MALWNYTIDDTSPSFVFSPVAEGDASKGWRTWYSQSGFNTSPNQVSKGDSFHTTSSVGANVKLQFYGTGISFYGNANASFDFIIDNNAYDRKQSNDLLCSYLKLAEGTHYVSLIARPGSTSEVLSVNYAVVSTPLGTANNPPIPIFVDNSNTTVLSYEGSWPTITETGVPNSSVSAPFHQTNSNGASVSWNMNNVAAVAVKGRTNSDSGGYTVIFDGVSTSYNASSPWNIPDTLLFFRSGLDPNQGHQIQLVNAQDGKNLAVSSVTVFQPQSKVVPPKSSPSNQTPAKSSSVNIGLIIGPIAAILIIGLIIAFFWWRRSRKRAGAKIRQVSPIGPGYQDSRPDSAGAPYGAPGVLSPFNPNSAPLTPGYAYPQYPFVDSESPTSAQFPQRDWQAEKLRSYAASSQMPLREDDQSSLASGSHITSSAHLSMGYPPQRHASVSSFGVLAARSALPPVPSTPTYAESVGASSSAGAGASTSYRPDVKGPIPSVPDPDDDETYDSPPQYQA